LFAHHLVSFACILGLIASAGCRPKKQLAIDYGQELPAGTVALKKISPDQYPSFEFDLPSLQLLQASIENSLKYLSAPSSKNSFPYLDITHERAVATCQAFKKIVDEEMTRPSVNPKRVDDAIRANFEVYRSIGAPDPAGNGYTGSVLFTGYHTPVYEARLQRDGAFQYPLYKRPTDLSSDEAGEQAWRQLPGGAQAPYYTRREIESQNVLAGGELVWLKSRWETYVISIQGSARLKLADGTMFEIGYAGNNGFAYPETAPADRMLADGVISKEQRNLKGLTEYFKVHPAAMDKYLWTNDRYVFFTERPGGPFGSLNVPVTTMASIATDKTRVGPTTVYPKAMPAFLIVPMPGESGGMPKSHRGFMMDQDTGGAIRAAGRCDIYMGVGPQAEARAGHQLFSGELYYIAVKPNRERTLE